MSIFVFLFNHYLKKKLPLLRFWTTHLKLTIVKVVEMSASYWRDLWAAKGRCQNQNECLKCYLSRDTLMSSFSFITIKTPFCVWNIFVNTIAPQQSVDKYSKFYIISKALNVNQVPRYYFCQTLLNKITAITKFQWP